MASTIFSRMMWRSCSWMVNTAGSLPSSASSLSQNLITKFFRKMTPACRTEQSKLSSITARRRVGAKPMILVAWKNIQSISFRLKMRRTYFTKSRNTIQKSQKTLVGFIPTSPYHKVKYNADFTILCQLCAAFNSVRIFKDVIAQEFDPKSRNIAKDVRRLSDSEIKIEKYLKRGKVERTWSKYLVAISCSSGFVVPRNASMIFASSIMSSLYHSADRLNVGIHAPKISEKFRFLKKK